MNKKLIKKIILKGNTELITGLHIGGTNTAMDIGGIDKSVIRNPLTGEPILPGSSLKGKMRSLLEIHLVNSAANQAAKYFTDQRKMEQRRGCSAMRKVMISNTNRGLLFVMVN